jgi:hypothetical protein
MIAFDNKADLSLETAQPHAPADHGLAMLAHGR